MGATARLFTYNRRRSDGIMLTLRVVITSSRPLLPDTIALCLRLHGCSFSGAKATRGSATITAMNLLFFQCLAEQSEVFDKYYLAAGLLLCLYFSTNSRREKISVSWTIILSFLVARLVVTPIIHFLYYQPHIASLAQLRLLESEQNDWPFPNGHAAFLLAIATAVHLYNKKWGIGFFIVVLFLNISRIVAGVHGLADIVGGMIIGVITATIIFYLTVRRRAIASTKG